MKDYFKTVEKAVLELHKKVDNGEIDTMHGYLFLKDMEKVLTNSLDQIGKDVKYKIQNYDLKTLPRGYTGRMQSRATYNYDACSNYKNYGDIVWQKKNLEENFVRAYNMNLKNEQVVDDEGVVIPPCEAKISESLVVTKKK